jgi:hypothetical protein
MMPSIPLVALASAFIAMPIWLSYQIDQQVKAFQREAFGHLRQAARYLRVLSWGIFVFYLAVVLGAYQMGHLGGMVTWPVQGEALQVYFLLSAAMAGLALEGLVARQLYLITVPATRATAASTAKPST